jgi:hypothetical protein
LQKPEALDWIPFVGLLHRHTSASPADGEPPVNGEIVAANATCQAVTPMTVGTTPFLRVDS